MQTLSKGGGGSAACQIFWGMFSQNITHIAQGSFWVTQELFWVTQGVVLGHPGVVLGHPGVIL